MDVRVIIVAAADKLRELYCRQVTELGIECHAVATLRELQDALKENAYNGLLVDLASTIRADKTEKEISHELFQLYPVLRLKWNEQQQVLRCLLYGSTAGAGISIASFIEDHCRPFAARRIRKDRRYALHFNVLISADSRFTEPACERSATIDISQSGCALFSTRQWEQDQVWIKILELKDQVPMKVRICRWTPWGTPMKLSTIGVCFLELSAEQQEQLEQLEEIAAR